MNASDRKPFIASLVGLADYYRQPLPEAALNVYWTALQRYPFAQVEAAMQAHISDAERGKWMPKVADIVAQIQAATPDDGHPSPDEAWGVIAQIIDNEKETAFLTEPMREAWAGCSAILELGDEVGARMCFREVYAKAVSKARRGGIAPRWLPTIGTDPEKRAEAARSALAAGKITQEQASALLPAPEPARVMGLLASAAAAAKDPDTARKGLEALKAAVQRMETRAAREEQERLERLAREREELQRLRDAAVAELLAKQSGEQAA